MKKQYRFLTMGALMGLLLTGVMPQAQAQDLNLDGTDNSKTAEVHAGETYGMVYAAADGFANDIDSWAQDHNARRRSV